MKCLWHNVDNYNYKMKKEKVWVWFKGGLKGGEWKAGFLATTCEEGGLLIENSDYISCRVPEWRVRVNQPENINEGPKIPEGEDWKLI